MRQIQRKVADLTIRHERFVIYSILQQVGGKAVPEGVGVGEFGVWKDVLPEPFAAGVRVFASQGKGQVDAAVALWMDGIS